MCFAKHVVQSHPQKRGKHIFRPKILLKKKVMQSTSNTRKPLSKSASTDAYSG